MCRRAPRTLIDQITVGPNTVTAGRDGTFRYSNQPFRFIGMNIRELVHFDAFEQAEQVSSARHFAGARVIRTWVPHRGKSIPETIAALNSLFASVPADQDSMFIAGAGTAWRCQRPTARARRRSALNRFFNELGADGALQWAFMYGPDDNGSADWCRGLAQPEVNTKDEGVEVIYGFNDWDTLTAEYLRWSNILTELR